MAKAILRVEPISGALGAEVSGVDLSGPYRDSVFTEIRQALLDHLVIFFRDQTLAPAQLVAFAERFGELDTRPYTVPVVLDRLTGHPQVLEVRKEPADHGINFGGSWHADVTFRKAPYLGSLLYAIEVPEAGGDTMWANLYLAYESLSEAMRNLLAGLKSVHSSWADVDEDRISAYYGVQEGRLDMESARESFDDAENGQSIHPVVRTHPETGREALFVNRAYTKRFERMTTEESQPLLQWLWAHSVRPEFTCRFRWAPGSLALWDNRCTLHNPLNDYHGRRRLLHRISIHGDRPV